MACESPPRKRAKLSLRFSRNPKERSPTKTLKKLRISPQDDELDSCSIEQSPQKDDHKKQEDESTGPPQPYVGFYNVGNTCYLNSVLQALRYCPHFVTTLREVLQMGGDWMTRVDSEEEEPGGDMKQQDYDHLKKMIQLLKEMHKVYELMQDKEDNFLVMPSPDTDMAINPEQVLEALRTVNPMFEGYLQHDAQELLCSLLSTLTEVREMVSKATNEKKEDITNNNVHKIGATPTSAAPNNKLNGLGSLKGGCSPNVAKSLKRTIQQNSSTPVSAKKQLCFSSTLDGCKKLKGETITEVKAESGEHQCSSGVEGSMNGKEDKKPKPRLLRKSMRNRQGRMPKKANGMVGAKEGAKVNGNRISSEAETPDGNVPKCERLEAIQKVGDNEKVCQKQMDHRNSFSIIGGLKQDHNKKEVEDAVNERGDSSDKKSEKKDCDVGVKDPARKKSRSLGMRRLYKLAGQLNILKRKKPVASPTSSSSEVKVTSTKESTTSASSTGDSKSSHMNTNCQGTNSHDLPTHKEDIRNWTTQDGNGLIGNFTDHVGSQKAGDMPSSQPTSDLNTSGTPTVTFKHPDREEGLFRGSLVLRTKCMECENYTERREEFQDISVPVHCSKKPAEDESEETAVEFPAESNDSCDVDLIPATLDWALSKFTSGERLTDTNKYFCDRCLHLSEAERCLLFDELPQIMVVHLKRFSTFSLLFSPGGSIPKINDHMATPIHFMMDRWCTKTCRQRRDTFRLLSVVTHTGSSSSSGHYLSYVRVPKLVPICTQDGEPQVAPLDQPFEWVLFDDDQVTALTDEEFYSGLNMPSEDEEAVDTPYLLFYTRVDR